MDMERVQIKYVAEYLRKSRGDNDSDLDKHRLVLNEMVVKHGWTSVEYHELESGDSIEMRPKMKQLLVDVTNGLYDAVCVVDIDRLGRGDMGDQDKIKKAFSRSKTLIVTPEHIYNLDNENDEFSVDVKSFIARQEYKLIVKRLVQGKKIGARKGMWTNGIPPFPYEYQKYKDKINEKGIIVNDEKLPIYRLIIDSIVQSEKTPQEIAVQLNKMGFLTNRGKCWSSNSVYRLAMDQTHLGWIVSNKTKGNGHKRKKESAKDLEAIPKSDWVIVKGCHEPVKTEDEHDKIISFFTRIKAVSTRKRNEKLLFTGLIKCGICGHTLVVDKRIDRNNNECVKRCWYQDYLGNKCINRGGGVGELYSLLITQLTAYEDDLNSFISEVKDEDAANGVEKRLQTLRAELRKKSQAVGRIMNAYEEGLYTTEQFKERKLKAENALESVMQEISACEKDILMFDKSIAREKVSVLQALYGLLEDDTVSGDIKNKALQKIVSKITWTRIGDEPPKIDFTFY